MDDPVLTLPQIRRLMLFYGVTIKVRTKPEPAATAYWTRDGEPYGWYLPVFKSGERKKWPWTLSQWTKLAHRITSGDAGWPNKSAERAAWAHENSCSDLNTF